MSESESFINEVTEEVRRDKLYAGLRRYGWIGVVAVLALVGGAAWNELSKAQAQAEAEATGDALLAAMEENAPADRAAAIAQISVEGRSAAVTALLQAGTQVEADDTAAAAATLEALAVNPDVPAIYADLAAFKAAMIDSGDDAARRASLEALSQPGAPFNLLASEQIALLDLSAGNTEAAIERLTAIIADAGVTQGLRERAQNMMVALGAPLPDAEPQN